MNLDVDFLCLLGMKREGKPSMGGQVVVSDNEAEYVKDWEQTVGFSNQKITRIFSVVLKEQTEEQMNNDKIKAVEWKKGGEL